MYVLSLNRTYLAMSEPTLMENTEFSLQKLSPYMTQKVQLSHHPEPGSQPVVSWQLANQIQEQRKLKPELKRVNLKKLDAEARATLPARLESFDKATPGRVLFFNANLKRGLSDMLLLQPILRAQASKLAAAGWEEKVSISSSNEFRHLFYGQDYVAEFLPEMPLVRDLTKFDHFMEFGLSLERMKSCLDISDWKEIDLQVRISVPTGADAKWKEHFSKDKPRIFLHWESFDKQRRLPVEWFRQIMQELPEYAYFCSLMGNNTYGEIFEGGPQNLWPFEQNLLDLFVILKKMNAVVTTNTGIAHIAAALGVPTIVIFTGALYGWADFWPNHHDLLYPSMQTVGLSEQLRLSPDAILENVVGKLKQTVGAEAAAVS